MVLESGLKVLQIIRYKNKRATARIWDARATVPEGIMKESRYGSNIFIDQLTRKKYKYYPTGMVAL